LPATDASALLPLEFYFITGRGSSEHGGSNAERNKRIVELRRSGLDTILYSERVRLPTGRKLSCVLTLRPSLDGYLLFWSIDVGYGHVCCATWRFAINLMDLLGTAAGGSPGSQLSNCWAHVPTDQQLDEMERKPLPDAE
jgi:hypothetical protein